MNKRFFVLIMMLAAISQAGFAQLLQQENLTHYNLNGNVKSFTETSVSKTTSGENSAEQYKRTLLFNPDRNIARLEIYKDGLLNYVRDYDYPPLGYSYITKTRQIIKGKVTWVDSAQRTYKYDDKKRIETTKGGNEPTHIGYYNNMGETDSIYVYDLSEKLFQKIYHLYDIGGSILETRITNPDGTLSAIYLFKWDNKARKILEQNFDAQRNLRYVRSHRYDEFDNETERRESVSESSGPDAKIKNTVSKYIYSYDAINNWIHREEFNDDGQLINTTERKIVYY